MSRFTFDFSKIIQPNNTPLKKETHRLGGMVQAKTTQDHHVIALSAEMEDGGWTEGDKR